MEISELISAAEAAQNNPPVTKFCAAVGIATGQYYRYLNSKSLPNDETVLRLCELAKIPPSEGLLWLNVWRSTGKVRRAYLRLAQGKPKPKDRAA